MSDIKDYEPLWGAWYVESSLGAGSFGKVYKVYKQDFDKKYYAAVKMISIPDGEDMLKRVSDDLQNDEASVKSYFEGLVRDIIQEVDMMSAFRGNSNIVSLEDYKIVTKTDAIGWDIFIRMELLETLSDKYKTLPPDGVIQLGIDIAHALELCALRNIVHRDIKPDNIFVSEYGDFKLGDFGVARNIERTTGMSKKGTETYMAPEVYKGEDYGPSVDLYSLGLVMYRYLNAGRTPFLPPSGQKYEPKDREISLQRRISGEPIPDIPYIDPELNAFVLKACAYRREDRFKDAEEFRRELERIAGVQSKPSVKGMQIEHAKYNAENKRRRKERKEDEGHTVGVFAVNRDEPQIQMPQEEKAPEIPSGLVNMLSLGGAVSSALLALLCFFSGRANDMFIAAPIYAVAAILCLMKFRISMLNFAYTLALIFWLVYSTIINPDAFDYPLLSLALGFMALGAFPRRKILGGVLAVCAVVSAVLVFMASGGSDSSGFKAFTAALYGIPLQMLITGGLMFLPDSEDGKIIGGLSAIQLFTFTAFVMLLVSLIVSGGSRVMMNIGNFTLVGLTSEKFLWWRSFRAVGIILQTVMCECFMLLASAEILPEIFMKVLADYKNAIITFGASLVIIIAGIFFISLMA